MAPKIENPCAIWDVTSNAADYTPEDIVEMRDKNMPQLFTKWAFQVERGEETGYLHYQIRGALFTKVREKQAIALIHQLLPCAHVTVTSNANKANFNYQLKLATRVEGPWTDRDPKPVYIPRQYRGLMDRLYPFQRHIVASIYEFEPRTINLVYCPNGNKGKSSIACLMALLHGCLRPPSVNDAEKLLQYVCDILSKRECRQPKGVFFDLPRAMDKTRLRGILAAIEEIKNGYSFDTRYAFKEWWFDSPAVWVFTNVSIDLTLLSSDRWRLWYINELLELVPAVPAS